MTTWPRCPVQHERHDTRIAVVTRENEDCGEADGMFTTGPDCCWRSPPPATCRCCWRGALAGIVDAFADLVRSRGGDPADWIAATGPAAHACCYEVGQDVIDAFVERWELAPGFVAPRPRRLDLPAIVRRQLDRAGIEAVAGRGECTMCHARADGRWTFHSYRRDRETRTPVVDVHWSAIAIADRQTAHMDHSSVPSTTR